MKAGAVGVHRGAAWPVGQAAVEAIERLQPVLARGFADDVAEVSGVQPSFSGDRALFVRRQSLDLPGRQEEIWKRVGRASEDRARHPRPAFGSIEVHDVRELVREDQAQPVLRLGVRSGRGHGVEDHGVVRDRRRVAVEQLGLIRQDDPGHRRRRDAERTQKRAPRVLGDARQPLRQALLASMEVDDEVFGRQPAEAQRRIDKRCRAGRAGKQQYHERCREPARHGRCPHCCGVWAAADSDRRTARARTMQRMSAGTPSRPQKMKNTP